MKYKLTREENKLFAEIDRETAKLPSNADLGEVHKVVAQVGRRYGLKPEESIAFFTRSTFIEFEP